ncbi:MAG: prolipoprotein diacylglyceryl transferase [Oscillospiraceae bacterium]|nr:prolipoprotein diacylglyceryl transferase [Oscillospiraceae bacterium]
MNYLQRLLIYNSMYVIGFIIMLILNISKHNTYRISRARGVIYSIITFVYGYLGAMLIGDLYNAVASLKGIETEVRVDMIGAVVFMLLWIPTVYIEKKFIKIKNRKKKTESPGQAEISPVSFRDTLDFIAPGAFLVLACIKFGCCFMGCCYGIECDWGVYSWVKHTKLFPVQIFEFISICVILVIAYYIKQTKFFRRGMAGPLTAGMYIFTRFCWEFLRYNTPELQHFFLGMTIWQIMCVIVFIIVFVWVTVLYITQPSQPMPKGYLFAKNEAKKVNNAGKKASASKSNKKNDKTKSGKKNSAARKRS